MKFLRRLGLWSLPLAICLGLGWALRICEARADLADALERLSAGDPAAAARLLETPLATKQTAPEARIGLAAAAALSGHATSVTLPAGGRIPAVTPLIRRELVAGRFESAARLAELSRRAGQAVDPWLEAAIRIELGQVDGLVIPASAPPGSRLAERVRSWADSPRRTDGVLLRDRRGEPVGWITDGTLDPDEGVDPAWLPTALATAAPSRPGPRSVRTTLDLELSRLAFESLGRFRGSIVLLDPATGEILAAVSDERTLRLEGGTPAFEQLREPASISKLLTTAALLRAGRDPDAEIAEMRCRGHERFDGELLYCPYIAGPLRGLDRAMAVSCNVAFAHLGVDLGRLRMVDELRRWGFEEDLGHFRGGSIHHPPGDRELADLSIGLEASDLTPLHAAVIAATVASGGIRPTPHLVAADDSLLGLHPRPRPVPAGKRVLDPEWVPVLGGAMEAVVDRGTARGLYFPEFPVAMKTGTASHPRWGFHVNYVGYGPRASARLAFAVRITHQGTSRQVRYVAKVVTGRLLRRLADVAEREGWAVGEPSGLVRSPAPLVRERLAAGSERTDEPQRPAGPTRERSGRWATGSPR